MIDETAYTPPKVWTWNKENGGQFANIGPKRADPHPRLRIRRDTVPFG
jgi:GST-like protein